MRAIAIVCSVAAVTAFAVVAYAAGFDSIGKGVIIGGSATVLVILSLWVFGNRAGTAGRIASGKADERDKANLTESFANAAMAMVIAALACTVAAFYGMPAELIGGAVIWAGLLTGLISLAVRTRQGRSAP